MEWVSARDYWFSKFRFVARVQTGNSGDALEGAQFIQQLIAAGRIAQQQSIG
jgi:hypothetical protein